MAAGEGVPRSAGDAGVGGRGLPDRPELDAGHLEGDGLPLPAPRRGRQQRRGGERVARAAAARVQRAVEQQRERRPPADAQRPLAAGPLPRSRQARKVDFAGSKTGGGGSAKLLGSGSLT